MDVQTVKLTVTKVELIEAIRKSRNAVCKKENTDRSTKITADEVMLSILHRLGRVWKIIFMHETGYCTKRIISGVVESHH